DIIPFADGRPRPQGLNDTDRLFAGELVYTGVVRTPVCAITRFLPWRGAQCPVAAELFATAADAYVLLGELPEEPTVNQAADGRPLTREFSRERMARMVCADAAAFSDADAVLSAAAVRNAQAAQVRAAVLRIIANMVPPECIVLSGCGEFLARLAVGDILPGARRVSLQEQLGGAASACAPAHALAVLAREGNSGLF
ncbi:MAG: hypothetical protein WD229_05725, partial [Pirellulales bacterium]